jgi:hypothetical protein
MSGKAGPLAGLKHGVRPRIVCREGEVRVEDMLRIVDILELGIGRADTSLGRAGPESRQLRSVQRLRT